MNRSAGYLSGTFRRSSFDGYGLSYAMADTALMPDDRLATWVLEMAERR